MNEEKLLPRNHANQYCEGCAYFVKESDYGDRRFTCRRLYDEIKECIIQHKSCKVKPIEIPERIHVSKLFNIKDLKPGIIYDIVDNQFPNHIYYFVDSRGVLYKKDIIVDCSYPDYLDYNKVIKLVFFETNLKGEKSWMRVMQLEELMI